MKILKKYSFFITTSIVALFFVLIPFSLYNNFDTPGSDTSYYTVRGEKNLATATANAICEYGYVWNGNKCVLQEGTFVVTPCQIKAGENSCTAKFSWNIGNPAPSSGRMTTNVILYNQTYKPVVSNISMTERAVDNNTRWFLTTASSGSFNFTLWANSSNTERATNLKLEHANSAGGVTQLASFTGYATCESGSTWSSGANKCIANVVPLGGTITAGSCTMAAGEGNCRFPLFWDSWQYVLDSAGNKTSTRITPVVPSTIDVYHDDYRVGSLDLASVQNGGPTAPTDGDAVYANGEFSWLFDEFKSEFQDGSYKTIPYYGLPDLSASHYYYVYLPYYSPNDDTSIKKNVTFKLMGHYKITAASTFDTPALRTKCSNEFGEYTPTYPYDNFNEIGVCQYNVVLAEAKVNATCGADLIWDDATNTCKACEVGQRYDSGSNSCATPSVSLSLVDAETQATIPTEEKSFLKKVIVNTVSSVKEFFGLRSTSALPKGSGVQIFWEAPGFNKNTVTCTMPNGDRVSSDRGWYPEKGSIVPNSTTTYSITCTD